MKFDFRFFSLNLDLQRFCNVLRHSCASLKAKHGDAKRSIEF